MGKGALDGVNLKTECMMKESGRLICSIIKKWETPAPGEEQGASKAVGKSTQVRCHMGSGNHSTTKVTG